MMYPFLQPTEEDKVLNEKVMGSCKQVGAWSRSQTLQSVEGRSGDETGECIEVLCVLLKYPKCFTENSRVE